jgi:hypothetical protein
MECATSETFVRTYLAMIGTFSIAPTDDIWRLILQESGTKEHTFDFLIVQSVIRCDRKAAQLGSLAQTKHASQYATKREWANQTPAKPTTFRSGGDRRGNSDGRLGAHISGRIRGGFRGCICGSRSRSFRGRFGGSTGRSFCRANGVDSKRVDTGAVAIRSL